MHIPPGFSFDILEQNKEGFKLNLRVMAVEAISYGEFPTETFEG